MREREQERKMKKRESTDFRERERAQERERERDEILVQKWKTLQILAKSTLFINFSETGMAASPTVFFPEIYLPSFQIVEQLPSPEIE